MFLVLPSYWAPAQKESHPYNRMASNDCLPYEKKSYFFTLVSAACVVSTVVVESGAGVGVGAVAGESVGVDSSVFPESLQATKAAIAKTNNSFFIVPFFVLLTNDFKVNTETGQK
jgi:hypothetical protein